MNEVDVVKKWIADLRSGEYRQGKFRLYNADDTYCCMGVLCTQFVKDKYDLRGVSYPIPLVAPEEIFEILNWYLGDSADRLMIELSLFNDEQGRTFAEIADYLEEFLLPRVENTIGARR